MARDRKLRAIPEVLVIVLALISASAAEHPRHNHPSRHPPTDSEGDENVNINVNHNRNHNIHMRQYVNHADGLQNGVEELLQYGSDLRSKILETLGTLVYDLYDEFSIDQLEALYRVYHDTLRRKYNIFEVAPKLKWQRQDLKTSEVCKTVLENICSCIKDSSKVCASIKTPNYRRSDTQPISKHAHAVNDKYFPKGLTLPALLTKIQKGELEITPKLISGILLNIPYDSFDNEVHRAEKILVEHLDSLNHSKLNVNLGNLNKFKTIDDFLKTFLEKSAEHLPPHQKKAAMILSEHVQRDTNSISENIENFGTTYENKTINLKYLFELVIPNDLVDVDIIKDRDHLVHEMEKNKVVSRYLLLDKYEHATPDQLLLEILRQMRKVAKIISFPPNVVRALLLHADFWRKDHTIDNVADFLTLFKAYDNLIDDPKFKEFFVLAKLIQEKLKDSKNVNLELTCTMPRPCLHRVLLKVLDCSMIDDTTKALVSKFLKLLDQTGRPILVEDPLNKLLEKITRKPKIIEDQSLTTDMPNVSVPDESKISDGYSIQGDLRPKPDRTKYTQSPEIYKSVDENEKMTTPDISIEESNTFTVKSAEQTENPVSINRFSTTSYTNIPEKPAEEEYENNLSTNDMPYTPKPYIVPTLLPTYKSSEPPKYIKPIHVTKHPKFPHSDKSEESKENKPKRIQLQPSGKSSTSLPSPDSINSKETIEESTVLPKKTESVEQTFDSMTKIPIHSEEETTTDMAVKATESINEISEESTTIKLNNEEIQESSVEDNKHIKESIEESKKGKKTDRPIIEEYTTIGFDEKEMLSKEATENTRITTTESSISSSNCEDSDSCVTESCEGSECLDESKSKKNVTSSSEECSELSCEQSSEKPCVGPDCSVTSSQSAECLSSSDEKCSSESHSENCSGPNCNTPLPSIPTQSGQLTHSTQSIHATEITESPETTEAPQASQHTTPSIDSSKSKEDCSESDCSASENCNKELCSSEKSCSSESCIDSSEKCEGPNCSSNSSICEDSKDEDCKDSKSKKSTVESAEQKSNDSSVACDSANCSEKHDSTCHGSNCDTTERTDFKHACVGSTCPSLTSEVDKQCTGKDCSNSNETASETEVSEQAEEGSVPVTASTEMKEKKSKTKLCSTRDPHRKRKVERLQKIREITALLAEQQEKHSASLEHKDHALVNHNEREHKNHENGAHIGIGLGPLFAGLSAGKVHNKHSDSASSHAAGLHAGLSWGGAEDQDSFRVNINENINTLSKRRALQKNSRRFYQSFQHAQAHGYQRSSRSQPREPFKGTRTLNTDDKLKTINSKHSQASQKNVDHHDEKATPHLYQKRGYMLKQK